MRINDDAARPYAAAAGATAGAWLSFGVSWFVAALAVALFVWRPRALLAFVAFAVAASFFAGRALDGLQAPATGPVEGWVTLLDDPRSLGISGVRMTVRFEGKRFEAQAHGPVSARFRDVLAGERVRISAVARQATGDWYRWRHVVGKLTVQHVHEQAPAAPLAALANSLRRVLAEGALSLSPDDRALFSGMVFGDDRGQSPRLADDFRAAGLGHLLVVSGQNVAFVLALASPVTTRLRPAGRLVMLLALLGVFAALTRYEPSVLRAVTMAAVAVTSAALGRPEAGRRALGWAIAVIVVVDPFLVRQLAFQLSVCATAGLLWITPALTRVMRGPAWWRLALSTTAGAQLGVLPLLIGAFGTVPLASLPVNMLAGPASGPVMMWGLTAGFGAGMLGGWMAWLIHMPTSVLLWWVRTVAAAAAAAPPAVIGPGGSAVLASGLLLVFGGRWRPRLRDIRERLHHVTAGAADAATGTGALSESSVAEPASVGGRAMGAAGLVVVLGALIHSLVSAAKPLPGWSTVQGADLYSHDSTVVVVLDDPGSPRQVLESVRLAGARRVDLIVATDGDASDAYATLALLDRYPHAAVIAPPMHRVPHARTVATGAEVKLGALSAVVVEHAPELEIEVSSTTPTVPSV